MINLSAADLGLIGLYFAVVLGIAWRARARAKSTEDYFLAGRSMHWMVVGISLFATLFSAISFVAVPGEAYKNGALMFLNSLTLLAGLPLAIAIFLRFFFQRKLFTTYEFLEGRFDHRVRCGGAVIFMLARLLYGATVFYAAAKLMHAFVGWSEPTTILVIGAINIGYAALGGMRAVMLTNVFQSAVLLLGLLSVLARALALMDFDVAGVWRYAAAHGHGFGALRTAGFYSPDPRIRYTIWLFLLNSVIVPSQNVCTDQLAVQRLLSCNGLAEARKSLYTKAVMAVVMMGLFYFVGLTLFKYYASGAATLPPGTEPDQVLGVFIAKALPAPFPGLMVAALLATLMGTIASTINSLSTVLSKDIIQRYGLASADEGRQVALGKSLTWIWGVLILALACLLSLASQRGTTTVFEVVNVWNSLWYILFVVFLLAILTRWITARAALAGLAAGAACNLILPLFLYYNVPPERRISFFWVGVPGMLLTAALMIGLSLGRHKTEPAMDPQTGATAPERVEIK